MNKGKGKAIFRSVCDAPDTVRAVSDLPAKDLTDLYSYLRANCSESGVSGQILGIATVESAERLHKGGNKA
ncbi:MAG: hypothetical protein EOP88_17115 [Verrucomicrobiaceae bacterium]|nr:MAG: hypothetical protein EOP88_17115 [Verrucomicrobiaceae bacterium]